MSNNERFYLVTLDPEGHSKTCNYWFLVRTSGFAHTAFTKRESLLQWLRERGMELTAPLPDTGVYSTQDLKGTYRERNHMSYDEFYALTGDRIKVISNGDYTLGIVTHDSDGIRTVHHLNPNCRERPVYDYRQTQSAQG